MLCIRYRFGIARPLTRGEAGGALASMWFTRGWPVVRKYIEAARYMESSGVYYIRSDKGISAMFHGLRWPYSACSTSWGRSPRYSAWRSKSRDPISRGIRVTKMAPRVTITAHLQVLIKKYAPRESWRFRKALQICVEYCDIQFYQRFL